MWRRPADLFSEEQLKQKWPIFDKFDVILTTLYPWQRLVIVTASEATDLFERYFEFCSIILYFSMRMILMNFFEFYDLLTNLLFTQPWKEPIINKKP